MEKYKICPTCGTKNPPTMIECINCETDLTGVPLGMTHDEESSSNNSPENSGKKMIRKCECGAINSAAARKCIQCGEDISDIIPIFEVEQDGYNKGEVSSKDQLTIVLQTVDNSYKYCIQNHKTIIGRENSMKEYLVSKPFVSRDHAELLCEAGRIWIKNHSHTNKTYINDNEIEDDKYIELKEGDIIGLGGKRINGVYQENAAFFIVNNVCLEG